jgi:molybdate-binding protein
LAVTGGTVVAFAAWAQGLMVARGNPCGLQSVVELANAGVRLINRESGSGSRTALDALLRRAGISPSTISGYRTHASSHLDGARAVAGGTADAAIGLETIASACGLDFVPLVTVRCDLVIPADLRAHPAVASVLDVLAGVELRTRLAAFPGYDVTCTGTVMAEVFAP